MKGWAKRAACVAVFAVAVPGMAAPAAADELALATGEDYAPFTGRELPSGGLTSEIVQRAFQTQGYDVELSFMSWRRAYESTASREVDATFPYVPTSERRDEMRYSAPLLHVRAEIISYGERPVQFDGDPASLAGQTICLPQGYAPEPAIKEMLDQDRLSRTKPYKLDKCLELVALGRADFFYINNFIWPRLFAESSYERKAFQVADIPLTKNTHHLLIARSHPDGEELMADFNAGLAALRDSGEIEDVIQKHMRRDS